VHVCACVLVSAYVCMCPACGCVRVHTAVCGCVRSRKEYEHTCVHMQMTALAMRPGSLRQASLPGHVDSMDRHVLSSLQATRRVGEDGGGAQVTVLGAVCVWLPNLRGSCPYGLSWNVWVVGAQVPACLLFAPPNPLPRTRTVEQRIGPSGLPHEPGGHTINTEIDAWGRGIFNFLLC
jgi:hypothetical protein